MDKVLIVLSDNNKGKFISKGFSSAFKDLNYFVYEKKIYDLNIDETFKISPDLIFIFWSDMSQVDVLQDFIEKIDNLNIKIIHCAELEKDIPKQYFKKKNHFVFSSNSKSKKFKYFCSVSPKDYKTKFSGYKYNITFAGNPAFLNREIILSKLIYNFGSINIFCRSYDFYKSLDEIHKNNLLDDYMIQLYKDSYKGYIENSKELARVFSSSKVNIDMTGETIKHINYRFLEVLASGGFLLAPYCDKTVLSFENGKEFESYSNPSDLIDKVSFYLKNLNIAQLIALNGKKNAVSNHSFYDRLKLMLKVVYGKNFSCR